MNKYHTLFSILLCSVANVSALAADLTTPANCDREISAQTSDCLFSNLLGVSYSEFYESVNASDGRYNRWNFTWFEPYGVIFKNIHDDQISGYVLFNDDLKKPILVDVKHSDPTYQYEFKFNQGVFSVFESHDGSYGIWHEIEEKFSLKDGCWRLIGVEWQGNKSEALLNYGEELTLLPIGFNYIVSINFINGNVIAKDENDQEFKTKIKGDWICLG